MGGSQEGSNVMPGDKTSEQGPYTKRMSICTTYKDGRHLLPVVVSQRLHNIVDVFISSRDLAGSGFVIGAHGKAS